MNSRWLSLVNASLAAFACLTLLWQVFNYHSVTNGISSIVRSGIRGEQLAKISDIVERDGVSPYGQRGRYLDLILPTDVRVFMPDMVGPTNYSKIGYFYYMTYYLFPREIGVSLDQPARQTKDGFLGVSTKSDQEILNHGFDVRIDVMPDGTMNARSLGKLPLKHLANPDWFDSGSDLVIAFLLPLLTALAGTWLVKFLFPSLIGQMALSEQLACGLGLGMMAVAALTLGVKLCGFHGSGLVLLLAAAGAGSAIWLNGKAYSAGLIGGCRKLGHQPAVLIALTIGLIVFLVLFRLAGLQGLVEFDAVMAWSLKAKILHLYTGNEIVQWFSNPRLAHAHLDYPTLVPSLHAATYDSIGHVNEFVTKFWPVWILWFLLAALASLNRGGKSCPPAPLFGLLGLLLLPVIQKYVTLEGGTLPMVFFTVMGFVQCDIWLAGKDRARLGLGLTLLFGAAMTKFEGFIFLALVGSWMLLLPAARPSLPPSPGQWRVLGFWVLAALPFICLRVQIPSLHFESGWAGYALNNPGTTLSNCPGIFIILLSRLFVNSDLANWSIDGGRLHWIGHWDGVSSLYNHSTLGLAWLCLLMTVVLWFAVPTRRPVIVWILTMLIGALAVFSLVFASLVNISTPAQVLGYTSDEIAGRYLLPVLLAWFATILTMLFADLPSSEPASNNNMTNPKESKSANRSTI